MEILIAGGHGKIAMELTRLLTASGDEVKSLIRNPDHSDEVREAGAEPVICDLEAANAGVHAVAEAIGNADVIVFAAGASPGSGPERKESMDYGGAVKLIEAAERNGIPRYVMITFRWTIPTWRVMRASTSTSRRRDELTLPSPRAASTSRSSAPGGLTDDPPTGKVNAGASTGRGEIPRANVAATVYRQLRSSPHRRRAARP